MAVIEVITFRLAPDVEETAFRDADARAQTEFHYRQPGLVRRTTACSAAGEWLVVTLWGSPDHADASQTASQGDPTVTRWAALLAPSSISTSRYETLD
jgi:hypothetical protein